MYDPQLRRRNRLVTILLIVTAFALGVHAERHGLMSPWHEPPDVRQTFRPFWETWYLVHEKYVDQSSVNDERMTQGSILGMLASLDTLKRGQRTLAIHRSVNVLCPLSGYSLSNRARGFSWVGGVVVRGGFRYYGG